MSADNHLILKKDSVIFYKVNLLLDVKFEEDAYLESSKLNSFFGQIGVYENSEKLLSLVNNLYKGLFFDYLVIKEKSDFKHEEEDYNMFFNVEENIFKNNNKFKEVYKDEPLVCLEDEDDNLNEDEMDETIEINDGEDDNEENVLIYIYNEPEEVCYNGLLVCLENNFNIGRKNNIINKMMFIFFNKLLVNL